MPFTRPSCEQGRGKAISHRPYLISLVQFRPCDKYHGYSLLCEKWPRQHTVRQCKAERKRREGNASNGYRPCKASLAHLEAMVCKPSPSLINFILKTNLHIIQLIEYFIY